MQFAPEKIEYRDIDDLIPYARNARTHNEAQVAQIAASIKEFGWTNPVLIADDGGIIAGHGRVMAARKLGMKEVPCIALSHMSETQRRAYVIADNQLALKAGWDGELLALELEELELEGFDVALTGFDDADIEALLAETEDAGCADASDSADRAGNLAEKFGIPPFSVLNARDGWWQDRKRAWLALGIRSELGRGEGMQCAPGGGGGVWKAMGKANAAPGGSNMPAMDYRNRERGDGRGRAIGAGNTRQ